MGKICAPPVSARRERCLWQPRTQRAQVRGPFQQDWDFYVSKDFPFAEKYGVQFRADFFNLFNHPNFTIDNTTFGTGAFGIYDNTVGNPRIAQLSLRFHF